MTIYKILKIENDMDVRNRDLEISQGAIHQTH